MIAGTLLAAIGVAEHFTGFTLATLSESEARVEASRGIVRISGPYAVPEVYGLSLLMCLAGTFYWLLMRARSAGAVTAVTALVALQVLATFFTFFRVGWISAIVVVVAATGLRPRRYARFVGTLVVAIAVVGLAFSFLERIPTVSSRVGNTDNIAARIATYEQGLQIFSSAPVFGVGATRYTDVAGTLPQTFVDGVGSVDSPHSSFVGTLAEEGAVGAIALLAVLVATWRLVGALRRRAYARADRVLYGAVVGAATAYLLYSLSLTMLPYGPSNVLMALLLGIVAGRIDRTAVRSPAPRRRPVSRPARRAVAAPA
jgi:O-antigen ligase